MKGIKLNDLELDRRGFVAAAAAATAALGMGTSLYGCDNRVSETGDAAIGGEQVAQADGTWVTLACSHGCGTRANRQA